MKISNKSFLFGIFLLSWLLLPHTIFAAPCLQDPSFTCPDFPFSLVSLSNNDEGFKVYHGSEVPLSNTQALYYPFLASDGNGNSLLISTRDAVCSRIVTDNGITPTSDTYCSYERSDSTGNFCISGITYPTSGYTIASCGNITNLPYVHIYQSAPEKTSLTNLVATLTQYIRDYIDWYSDGKVGQAPLDPGYSDICPVAHADYTQDLDLSAAYITAGGTLPLGGTTSGTCELWRYNKDTPTASLSASPSSIVAGNTSLLTYSCTNSISASISSGVGTLSNVSSGSVSVSPATTTTYTLTCTGATDTATASAEIIVEPALTTSCSVSPTTITAGSSATWSATASGGTGTYSYVWSGTDSLTGSTQSVVKSYATEGTKTASVTVTSGAQSLTQACTNSLTVSPAAQADLTAGSVSPTSATAGQSVSLSATASNIGSATSGSFPLLFQIQSPADLKNSSYLAAIASGASRSGSVSHTFASPGSYQVRACANFNTSWTTIVTESNYDNNCGPWTTITVEEAAPSGALSCTVSNANPTIGQTVTYTASGASAPYTWTPSDGVGSYGTGATANRTFSANGSYGMTVTKSGYTAGNCPVVLVGTPGCGTADASITATPDRVRADNNSGVSLSFSASGVDTSCTISGPGVSQTVTPNACVVGSQSIQTPQITQQSVYRINCDSGESIEEVVVNLIPRFDEF